MTVESYPCYVKIGDGSEELIEVPTEKDGTMLLTTVQAQFSNALGLRFKSESGAWRGVRVDGNVMDPPPEGWGEVEYSIVLRKVVKRGAEDNEDGPGGKLSKMTKKEILSDMIVLGLPYAATEEDLKTHFGQFGELQICQIKYDKNKKSRGFGFIRFKTVEAVEAALEATHILHNRRCELNFPKQNLKDDITTKLFVGRLPPGTTVEDLRGHFGDYGVLKDVYIPSPFRGFGFITFGAQADADEVLSTTHVLKGTFLNVSYPSVKRPETNPPGYDGMQGNNIYGGNMQVVGMYTDGYMQGMQMQQGAVQPGLGYGYGGNQNYNYHTGKTPMGNYGWSGKS